MDEIKDFSVLLGCVLGALFVIMVLGRFLFNLKWTKVSFSFDPTELHAAFSRYLDVLTEAEDYHTCTEVCLILKALKKGEIPGQVYYYDIQRWEDVVCSPENHGAFLRRVEHYQVKGRKRKLYATEGA